MKIYKTRRPLERLNVRYIRGRDALRVAARGTAVYIRLPRPGAMLEAVIVLALTAILFKWGVAYAYQERGYFARGGECLLLFTPGIYYAGKRTVLDWIADLREEWRRRS